jgi:hypothetical protein
MRVYAPIALALLTAVAFWFLPSVASARFDRAATITAAITPTALGRATDPAWRMILGFSAMSILSGVDFGVIARGRRDLVLGGLTGIALAASWTASMSLVSVEGAASLIFKERGSLVANMVEPFPLSFRWAVFHGIGGVTAGAILVSFGLAALAPACYAVRAYGETLAERWPRLGHAGWTWIGGAIALALAATSNLDRLDVVYSAMGAVIGPALGAIAGDWVRQRGGWSKGKDGVAADGVIAWVAGLVLAAADAIAPSLGPGFARWAPPASICGFAASFIVFWLLAGPPRGGARERTSRQETPNERRP